MAKKETKIKSVKTEVLTIEQYYKNYYAAKTVKDKKKYYDLISKILNK